VQHQQSPRFVVAGEIDMATAEQLRCRLEEHVATSHGDVVLDCRELSFIDACGIKVFLDVAVAARSQGRRFMAANVGGQCRRTFHIAGVDRLLGIDGAPETPAPRAHAVRRRGGR
jgi:anti-sigma B factor antagonist